MSRIVWPNERNSRIQTYLECLSENSHQWWKYEETHHKYGRRHSQVEDSHWSVNATTQKRREEHGSSWLWYNQERETRESNNSR